MQIKKSLKRTIRKVLYHAGFELVPRGSAQNLLLVETLRRLFLEHRIETVLDVGGNVGQFGVYLRQEVGYAGRIISFEPSPVQFATLKARAQADGKWNVFNVALGEVAGTLPFNLMRGSDFSSFLTPSNDGIAFDDNEVVETIQVEIVSLDSMLASMGLDLGRTYLKTDTQGFDLPVLRGAREALRQIPALQTELSFLPIYDTSPESSDALRELKGFGFDVVAFCPVTYNRNRLVEADCVMQNSRLT